MNVEVDGATLYVEVDGPESNPALLLRPPGRCTVRVWDHWSPGRSTDSASCASISGVSVGVRRRRIPKRSTPSSSTRKTPATCSISSASNAATSGRSPGARGPPWSFAPSIRTGSFPRPSTPPTRINRMCRRSRRVETRRCPTPRGWHRIEPAAEGVQRTPTSGSCGQGHAGVAEVQPGDRRKQIDHAGADRHRQPRPEPGIQPRYRRHGSQRETRGAGLRRAQQHARTS